VGKTRVIIVNQTMARLLWPDENPVGRKVNDYGAEVIGVIGDVRYAGLDRAPAPEVYYPEGVFPQDEFSLVVRTAANNASMIESIRKAIHEVEADVFIGNFQSMNELVASSEGQRRFVTILLSVFSGTGLLLAVAGIAGIVAYSLSLRVREIAIRVAMGATSRDVLALISRQGVVPAFAGLVFGCILAVSLTRFLSALLFEVDPYDPAVFAAAIIALAFVCIVTAGLSAYRACRVDASSILK
jgi:putative ABC transport system permease protein